MRNEKKTSDREKEKRLKKRTREKKHVRMHPFSLFIFQLWACAVMWRACRCVCVCVCVCVRGAGNRNVTRSCYVYRCTCLMKHLTVHICTCPLFPPAHSPFFNFFFLFFQSWRVRFWTTKKWLCPTERRRKRGKKSTRINNELDGNIFDQVNVIPGTIFFHLTRLSLNSDLNVFSCNHFILEIQIYKNCIGQIKMTTFPIRIKL